MRKNNENNMYEGCIGERLNASQVVSWLKNLCNDNFYRSEKNIPRWTGNIWGRAGGGKTSIVKSFCNIPVTYKGKEYPGYKIVDIPLAQIEEMGDILGMPDSYVEIEKSGEKKWILDKDAVIESHIKDGWNLTDKRPVTRYSPPEWVPTESCPGIIIFDDGNRASPRIMKGLMQLIQDYRTISWSIPDGWTIVFTGNPDTSEYSVTTQDDAQITRMRHVTLKPDAKEWVNWASNNNVDARGIAWVLRYPEMVENVKVDENGFERTNFRTLTEFFRCLERYPNRELTNDERYMLQIDGKSLLDSETVASFMSFMEMDMKLVIEPERILKDSNPCIKEVYDLMKGKEPRIDIVSVTCNRLLAYLSSDSYEFKQEHVKNFQNFMTCDHENPGLGIPKDISQSIMRQLIRNKNKKYLVEFIRNNNIIREWGTEALKNTRIINSF